MRLLCTSDWQVHAGNLSQCEAMLTRLLEVMRQERVTHVLHLGDAKDTLNPVDQRASNFLVRATKAITKQAPFYVLLGNHDRTTMSDESESCLPVMAAAGAVIFEQPGLANLKGADCQIYMVPWMRDREALLEALKNPPAMLAPFRILAMHADMTSARYSLVNPKLIEGGLSAKDLRQKGYNLCLSGHIHMPQTVDGVTYVGSPFAQDWGEVNQTKRFLMVEYVRPVTVVTSIPTGLPGLFDPDIKGFPKNQKWLPEDRIRIRTNVANLEEIERNRAVLQKQYPNALIQISPVIEDLEVTTPDLGEKQNDEELLRRYLDANPVQEPKKTIAYLKHHLPKGGMYGIPPLKFKSVEAIETLCFRECQLDLRSPGITLVTGVNKDWEGRSNGSGKTSAQSLPVVALFGVTPKGQCHDSWRRYDAKGKSVVRLEMTLANGAELIVLRGRHPSKLEVCLDGKDQTLGSIPATQAWIEKTTGLTWDVLTNALYIGQREVGTILTGTPKMRKELFSRFLGLDRFIAAEEAVRKNINRVRRCLIGEQEELRVADSEAEQQREAIAHLQTQRVTPDLKRLKAIEAELKALETSIPKAEEVVSGHQEQRVKHVKVAGEWAQEVARWDERWRVAKVQQDKLKGLKDVCPLCKGPISAADKAKHLQELSSQQAVAEEQRKDCQQKEEGFRRKAVLADRDGMRDQEALRDLRIQKEDLTEEMMAIIQTVETAKILDGIITTTQKKQASALQRQRLYQQCIAVTTDDLKFLESALAVVHRDGLPAFLCASVGPQLNRIAQRYSEMFSEGEIQVKFLVENGELDVQITNAHGGKDVGDQSQGELRMAGLVAAFTLREALVPYNLLMLDEPGDGLDSINARTFAMALKEVAKRFGSLFITTHNPNILSALEPDHRLEVVKQNGIAVLRSIDG